MKEKIWMALFVLCLAVSVGNAQDTLTISQSELLERTRSGNLQLEIAEKNYESARADFRQSNTLFLPTITASHTAMLTTNPLMAFGFKLNQERLTQADFNPTLLNDPDRIANYATMLEVKMPLINLDGMYQRQAARSKMEAYELQNARTSEYLELEVTRAYMQLQLAYEAVHVLDRASQTAQANLKLIEDYKQQGLLQRTDVLDVQIRVNEVTNQLAYARSNVKNASDYLAFLMNEEQGTVVYWPADSMDTEMLPVEWVSAVPGNRKDLMAMDKTTEAYQKMVSSGRMNLLPRLNAFGSYQLYDQHLFGFGAQGYLIGAQLSWTLFDGYQSIGKMEKGKVEYRKAEMLQTQYLAQSQLELNKTNRELLDVQNKVSNAHLAWEQSRESYRIRSDRFQQGLEKTTDLLTSEAQYYQKELEYLQALFQYHYTSHYLQFLTH